MALNWCLGPLGACPSSCHCLAAFFPLSCRSGGCVVLLPFSVAVSTRAHRWVMGTCATSSEIPCTSSSPHFLCLIDAARVWGAMVRCDHQLGAMLDRILFAELVHKSLRVCSVLLPSPHPHHMPTHFPLHCCTYVHRVSFASDKCVCSYNTVCTVRKASAAVVSPCACAPPPLPTSPYHTPSPQPACLQKVLDFRNPKAGFLRKVALVLFSFVVSVNGSSCGCRWPPPSVPMRG